MFKLDDDTDGTEILAKFIAGANASTFAKRQVSARARVIDETIVL